MLTLKGFAVSLSVAVVASLASPARAQPVDPIADPTRGDRDVVVEWSSYDDVVPEFVGSDTSEERLVSQDFGGSATMVDLSWAGADPIAVWLQQEIDGVWGDWEMLVVDQDSHLDGDRPGTEAMVVDQPDAFRFLVEGAIEDAMALIGSDLTPPTGRTAPPTPSSQPAPVDEVDPDDELDADDGRGPVENADQDVPVDEADVALPGVGVAANDGDVPVKWTSYDESTPPFVGSESTQDRLVSQDFIGPALMTGLTWGGGDPVAVWIQQENDGVWGDWESVSPDHAHAHGGDSAEEHDHVDEGGGDGERPGTDVIVLAEPDAFRFLVEGTIEDAFAFVFRDQAASAGNAGPTVRSIPAAEFEPLWTGPSFVRDRSSWDTTNCRVPGAEFNFSSSRAVIVHHTASSNNYSQSQVPSLIRGLCAYQTGSRELDDVGYNFIVDRFGTVWEGRTGSKGAPITSAHARGFNYNTQGVVLLGNYDAASPPSAQVAGLRSILNWLTGWYGIDPDGRVTLVAGSDGAGFSEGDTRRVDGVAGHREVGQTSCPGGVFFPSLKGIAASTSPTNFGSTPTPGNGGIVIDADIRSGRFSNDANNDGNADVIALRSSNQTVYTYLGNGRGGWGGVVQAVGLGAGTTATLAASDWNGDGRVDIITRRSDGRLFLSRGVGNGTFSGPVQIGKGWNSMTAIFSPGDWDGDSNVDLLARRSDGKLFLYRGNGSGGFLRGTGTEIGRGWQMFNQLFSPGDFTGDDNPDVMGRDAAGRIWLYNGNGSGGWRRGTGQTIGSGWNIFTEVESSGDFDGDDKADVLAYGANGTLCLYRGNGLAGWSSNCTPIGKGWQIMARLL